MIALGSSELPFGEDAMRYFAGFAGILIFAAIISGFVWAVIRLMTLPNYYELIREWCTAQGMSLVALDRRRLWRGPFFFSPNGTAVFYITTRDRSGAERHFWMRIGHWLFGVLIPELQVRPAD